MKIMPVSLPFFKSKTPAVNTQEELDLAKIKEFSRGLVSIQDIIAPEAIEVDFTYQKINSTYTRTLFAGS